VTARHARIAGWIVEPPFTGEEALDFASLSRFADGETYVRWAGDFPHEMFTLGTTQWIVYKVLEKEASRDLDEDQTKRISDSAYQYWLEQAKLEHGVDKHILEF